MNDMRDRNRKPTHPGAILREDVLPALKMSQAEFAARLDVHRVTLSNILHERSPLTADMAARVGKLLDTSPESWLAMQGAVDLWEIQQHSKHLPNVKPLRLSAAA